ncbi:MAG: four helix bundle protein [Verrucomicrobia bacterium]|nr:four helix bundle protein [Verrucomicrobiota bacterium]
MKTQPNIESPPLRPPLPFARSFKELAVYQKARVLTREVFKITKRFPREEAYSLTDQWRRAARSIGAQISEAWAKRRYPKSFVSKLADADGEQMETQHWTIVAYDDGYISREEAQRIGSLALEVGRMLGDMIQNPESFCGDEFNSALRETPSHYFVDTVEHDPLNTEY